MRRFAGWVAVGALVAAGSAKSARACDNPKHADAPAAVADSGSSGGGVELIPHPVHYVIPELAIPPKLSDFLAIQDHSPVAAQMLRVRHFVERYPDDGGTPDDGTTAYMGYTHRAFFVAFVCRDTDPKLIRAHMAQRDNLGNDDSVTLMLDTFDDHRRAFVFQSNPLGIQADAMYSEESGYDYSFNTVWDTWGQLTRFGYVVLMRIPFASLYFAKTAPGDLRRWGIILRRNVAATGESDYWPRIRYGISGQLAQDMTVEGFGDIARGRNIQIDPYTLARSLRQLNTVNSQDPYFEHKHLQGISGLSAKMILHNSLVLDTTVNPDFSQVGVDNPAAPNQRFPSFFPEVRPFFIENSSYFQTPINLYYTDKIVMPEFGARLTGKAGPWALGLLSVDDRGPGAAVVPGSAQYGKRAEDYVGRIDRDVGKLSNVGVIYADREYQGSFNRAGGFDYRARIDDRWTVTGQALTSATKNLSTSAAGEQGCMGGGLYCSGQAYMQSVKYSSLHTYWDAGYDDTAAGFVTDTGFFRRPDVRQAKADYNYTFRPYGGAVLSDGPNLYVQRIWDHNGVPLNFYVQPSYSVNFEDQTFLNAHVGIAQDRLRPIDFSQLAHDVEFHTYSGGVHFYSSPVPYLGVGLGYERGTTLNYSPPGNEGPAPVDVASPSVSLDVKPLRAMDLQNSYVFTRFSSPENGATVYDNHQLVARWNYQLTKAASFNVIGQYISTLPDSAYTSAGDSKTVFADALFTYMPHPGTALYVGYIGNFANLAPGLCTREASGLCNPVDPILPTDNSLMNDGRTIYVKMTYLLRF
ncbi:MAG: carbohydrate binding family 9 domain-containing protein [Acidobacteriaceae bacterium]